LQTVGVPTKSRTENPPGFVDSLRYWQQEAQSSPQQAAHVAADAQQLPSQDLPGDDAHAAVASVTTASAAANRIIFFITIFLSRGGFDFLSKAATPAIGKFLRFKN
jgi:hypothetical protein